MDIIFGSSRLRKACCNSKDGVRHFGATRAKLVRRRLDDLRAADNLAEMRKVGGCHELKRSRKFQLAVRLDGGFRLVFVPGHNPIPTKPDGGLDWTQVTIVKIIGVEDYHD